MLKVTFRSLVWVNEKYIPIHVHIRRSHWQRQHIWNYSVKFQLLRLKIVGGVEYIEYVLISPAQSLRLNHIICRVGPFSTKPNMNTKTLHDFIVLDSYVNTSILCMGLIWGFYFFIFSKSKLFIPWQVLFQFCFFRQNHVKHE